MKKFIPFLILICVLVLVTGCSLQKQDNQEEENSNQDQQVSQQEQEFNNSGRAKAIENESDLWPYYENEEAGFALNYPYNVVLGTDNMDDVGQEYYLSIYVDKIDSLEGPMGYDRETAEQNMIALAKGEYGQSVDFALVDSRKVISLGKVNAQEFMVLARFEICDVTFEKKLYFFHNGYQIVITLHAPEKTFANELNGYLIVDEEVCGEEPVWDLANERDKYFYKHTQEGKMSAVIQDWNSAFDKIVKTIKFFDDDNQLSVYDSLQGKWISIDDEKSAIEFSQNKKIDYYADELAIESDFEIYADRENSQIDTNGKYLIVGAGDEKMEYEIIEVTDEFLTLIYLGRGNILKYYKIENCF